MSSRIPNVLTVSQPIPKIRASTNLRVRLPRPHRDHARHFTTSKPARAVVGKPMIPKGMAGQMPAQQGLKSRMKTVQMGQIPNDLGLMPQTLIRPSSKRLPKLFSSSWKERLRFEWVWTRTRFQNIFSIYLFSRWQVPKDPKTGKKQKRSMHLNERYETARKLHKQYYTALAEGDMTTIRKIACKGLVDNSEKMVLNRKPDEKYNFTIMKYRGLAYSNRLRFPLLSWLPYSAAHIVSDKLAPLPFGKGNMLRQMVVRIISVQRLENQVTEKGSYGTVDEYVVLQKLDLDGEDSDWRIWGTTKESKWEEIRDLIFSGSKRSGPTIMDRFQAQAQRLTG